MSEVRTDPLTPEEIAHYHEQGFLFPIRVLDDAQVEEAREALDDHLEGRRQSETYELTDPIVQADKGTADRRLGNGERGARRDGGEEAAALGAVPLQPLGARRALLEDRRQPRHRGHGAAAARLGGGRPDGGRRGGQEAGRRRQARLAPGLRVLAARLARRRHVLDRARRRATRDNGGMQVAVGSHKLGEKLPVEFGDGSSFMHDERPGLGEVTTPEAAGLEVAGYSAEGRRVRLPPCADLARVGPEHEPEPAPRLHPALRRRRDDLAGGAPVPLQLQRRGARVRAR